mgnify:FL=1
MIAKENYSREHIEALYRESGNDPALLERVSQSPIRNITYIQD